MGKEVYLVIQEGVYRHGIFGIFTTRQSAVDLANQLARTDGDDYHSYSVIPFIIDKPVPRERHTWFGGFHGAEEKSPIYSTNKSEVSKAIQNRHSLQ